MNNKGTKQFRIYQVEIEISLLPHICLCGLYLGTIFCPLLTTKLI